MRKKRKQRLRKIRLTATSVVLILCLCAWLITNSQFVKGLIYRDSTYEKNTVLQVDESISGSYSVFGNDILFTTKNGLCLYSMDGELIHTGNYDAVSAKISSFINPSVRMFDDVICVFDKGGRDILIFDNRKIINEAETEYNIQSVRVFENGSFAAITADAGAKNQMILYNENGKREFVWHSGVDNIIDVSITKDGSKIALISAELNSGHLNSKILFFNKGETKAFATKKYDNILATNISFIGGTTFLAVSDSALIYLGVNGEESGRYSFNERFLSAYEITDNGSCVLNFKSISDSSNETEIIGRNGKLKGSYSSDSEVTSIDVKNNNILLTYENAARIISMRGNKIRDINYGRELEKVYFIGRNKILLLGKSEVKIIR